VLKFVLANEKCTEKAIVEVIHAIIVQLEVYYLLYYVLSHSSFSFLLHYISQLDQHLKSAFGFFRAKQLMSHLLLYILVCTSTLLNRDGVKQR